MIRGPLGQYDAAKRRSHNDIDMLIPIFLGKQFPDFRYMMDQRIQRILVDVDTSVFTRRIHKMVICEDRTDFF